MTLYISWSALRTHEECKQKGYLKREKKSAPMANTRIFFPGTVTDRVVRDWLRNEPAENVGGMPDMVSSIIERERDAILEKGDTMLWKDKSDRDQVEKECREAVSKIEPALLKYVVPFRYQADFRFKAPIKVSHPAGGTELVVINGYMDIIVQDDLDRYWVWDVKHTRNNEYYKKTAGQIGVYDLAVEIMFGKPTVMSGLLQPLATPMVKRIPTSGEFRSQLMQRVAGMANDVWTEDRTPRADTSECTYCEVKHACSRFTPVKSSGSRRITLI